MINLNLLRLLQTKTFKVTINTIHITLGITQLDHEAELIRRVGVVNGIFVGNLAFPVQAGVTWSLILSARERHPF